jgi:hypothetical protein
MLPEVGSFRTRGEAWGVTVVGDYAYIAAGGLEIVNVSNPRAVRLVGSFDKPGNARGVAVRGRYAFVADKAGKLWVVDVSDPTKPEFVSSLNIAEDFSGGGEPHGLVLDGNYVYLADDDSAMHIVDISDKH